MPPVVADDGSRQRKHNFRTAVEDVKALAAVIAMEVETVLGRRPARGLGVLALFAIVVGTLLFLLDWYVNPGTAGERKDLILTVAQVLGGTALLLGLYFTWRTLGVNREGQITDRFTRAIDQLGSTGDNGQPRLEIRLGGIYALERIARDSPKRDYSTVMDVLTAYVRENTSQASGPSKGSSEAASTSNEATTEADEGAKKPAQPGPRRPTGDIQAILDVLRRTQDSVPEESRTRLDLHEANLRGAHLEGANLEEANLRRAHLEGADLEEAILQGAHLRGAHLEGADLEKAILRGARLQEAHLEKAILRGADLEEAILQGARLRGARLRGANLEDAHLQGANLEEAILQGARLRGAKVTDKQLADTLSLQGATMPDGQKHEDWLKDKEGSGKDVENE